MKIKDEINALTKQAEDIGELAKLIASGVGISVEESTADRAPKPRQFVNIGKQVMDGAQCVAVACSKTFAKRIARALNAHEPNREGV